VQVVYRVGRSLAPLSLTVVTRGDLHAYGFWALFELHRDGGGWAQGGDLAAVGTSSGTGPYVYGVAGAPGACPAGPGCSVPGSGMLGDSSVRFSGLRPRATSRYYVVSAYDDVRVEAGTPGWRVRDVRGAQARRVLADRSAGSTGAGVLGGHAEHFTSATAPGGRYGSVVFAALPCESGGVGAAVLTGRGALAPGAGMPPVQPRCSPTTYAGGFTWAYSRRPTEWLLSGDVKGVGSGLTRLFVFDLPRP
jgi:hypothetical protein